MRGLSPVSLQDLAHYDVNVEGQPDVIWQPLWDYQAYPNAGFTGERLFFQQPIGTGTITLEDTNMTGQGRVPTPVNHLITGIECVFWPGIAPAETAANLTTVGRYLNDLEAVHNARMSFKLTIGDKTWLEEGPLGVFPSQFYIDGPGAAQTLNLAAVADRTASISYAAFRGPMYQVMPYRLISNQQFAVTVRSPAAVALPSATDARWGFRLHGYRFRLAQ